MKKIVFCTLLILFSFGLICGIAVAKKGPDKLIANFENGSYAKDPEWWKFDSVAIGITNNTHVEGEDKVASSTGKHSLNVSGVANNWYSGGFGTYLGIDARPFSGVQMDIYGNGPKSGAVKLELVDDDDSNWEVLQDPKKAFIPTKDDRWVTQFNVDWKGWRRVYIPFEDFSVDNPGCGNGIWDPYQTEGSGGLLTMQFICLGNSKSGKIDFTIDNIMLVGSQPK